MMSYEKWWDVAHSGDSGPDEPHYYLKHSVASGMSESNDFVGKDLTHYRNVPGFFVVQPREQRVRSAPPAPAPAPGHHVLLIYRASIVALANRAL